MCHKTICDNCGKPTWEGCGDHIEQALADVPTQDRCQCPRSSFRPATDRHLHRPAGGTIAGSW